MLRAALFVLRLAGKRMARRAGVYVLAALGLAGGAAVVIGTLGGTAIAQDRGVSQAIERIPPEVRSVRAVWFGVPSGDGGEELPALDRRVREALAGQRGEPARLVLFRESTVGGRYAGVGAVDRVAPHVVLLSGRLPRQCRPDRCEVVRLRGAGPIPNAAGLRLVEVGRARLRSRLLFGDFIAPTDNALAQAELAPALQRAVGYHRPAPAPLLLAEGVAGLTASPALRSTYRSHAWVWPLEPGRPRLWEIDELAARVDRARSDLKVTAFAFDVTAPTEELRAAERASTVAGRRLLLVGGEAAALLFAFAVLAAAALRRDLGGARSRLRLAGARRWQVALLTGAESAAVAAGGTALGWLAGLGVSTFAAERSGTPVTDVLRESVLSGRGLLVAPAVAVAATVVLTAAVAESRHGRTRALDLLALAAVAVVVVAVTQGRTDATQLGEGGGALLLLLPGLLSFAAAVAAARLLAPALRLLARAARRRLDVRLAALSLARGPGTATIAAAFLVVSVSLAVLAEGYRATLERGERDAAAAHVPLDFVVREDLRRLVPVQEAAPLERFRALGEDVGVVPVFRASGGAGRVEGLAGLTLLGLPAASVPRLRGFDGGERLAARIDPGRRLEPEGPRVSEELTLTAAGDAVRLEATVLTPSGAARSVPLGVVGKRPAALRAALPTSARGGRLLAIDLLPDTRLQERGADAGAAQLVRVRLRGAQLDGWLGDGGARVSRSDGGVLVEARLTPQRVARVRAPQPTDGSPPRVLATPLLSAAAGGSGLLPVQIGGTELAVEVVGTVPRMPGAPGEVLAGDVGELVTALNAARPGAARVNEVWLSVPGAERAAEVEAALAEPPFRPLLTVSRRALETDSSRDPLAHGTLLALLAAALVALALAVAGLTLAVLADLRDERGELLDLEAEGASPRLLRRVVRMRALVVAVFGISGGAATGAVLAAIVTDVVAVTARAREPEPPLVLTLDPVVIAAAALCYAALAGLLVLAATRRAFSAKTAL